MRNLSHLANHIHHNSKIHLTKTTEMHVPIALSNSLILTQSSLHHNTTNLLLVSTLETTPIPFLRQDAFFSIKNLKLKRLILFLSIFLLCTILIYLSSIIYKKLRVVRMLRNSYNKENWFTNSLNIFKMTKNSRQKFHSSLGKNLSLATYEVNSSSSSFDISKQNMNTNNETTPFTLSNMLRKPSKNNNSNNISMSIFSRKNTALAIESIEPTVRRSIQVDNQLTPGYHEPNEEDSIKSLLTRLIKIKNAKLFDRRFSMSDLPMDPKKSKKKEKNKFKKLSLSQFERSVILDPTIVRPIILITDTSSMYTSVVDLDACDSDLNVLRYDTPLSTQLN